MTTITPYSGASWQRGYGLGSIFRGLFRTAIPLLRSRVGRSVVKTGAGLASDAIRGKNMREALAHRVMQGIGDVVGPRRTTTKRKRPVASAASNRGKSSKGKVVKRARSNHADIFG